MKWSFIIYIHTLSLSLFSLHSSHNHHTIKNQKTQTLRKRDNNNTQIIHQLKKKQKIFHLQNFHTYVCVYIYIYVYIWLKSEQFLFYIYRYSLFFSLLCWENGKRKSGTEENREQDKSASDICEEKKRTSQESLWTVRTVRCWSCSYYLL